jgi:hypothetical protein
VGDDCRDIREWRARKGVGRPSRLQWWWSCGLRECGIWLLKEFGREVRRGCLQLLGGELCRALFGEMELVMLELKVVELSVAE